MAAKKSSSKKSSRKASRRTLIKPQKGDKRYVRRKPEGQFKDMVDVRHSLAADKRRKSKKTVPRGQEDRGDTR